MPRLSASTARRVAIAVAFATAPAIAVAQTWSTYAGVAGRLEYNDNYFFTASGQPVVAGLSNDPESAFTLSILPFFAASRRTEVSDVTALLSIGGNKVWGISPEEEYLSGSFVLNGTLRDDRATWSGSAQYARSPQLQTVLRGSEPVRARTYTDAASVQGSYSYAVSERWTAGASVGIFANRYDAIEGVDQTGDDVGASASATLGYAFSEQTQLRLTPGYTYYRSDLERSEVATVTLGVIHRISAQLSVSGSVGGFWSDNEAREAVTGPGGTVQPGEQRSDNGTFFGAGVSYAVSEATQFDAGVAQGLAPSGAGALSKNDSVRFGLSHRFSERLTGRVGADYTRNEFLAALQDSYSDKTVSAQAGLTYRLAESWKLDAGYQYTKTRYSRDGAEPKSNIVFVSVGYNWPGETFTPWVGRSNEMAVLPGARPLTDAPSAPTTGSPSPAPLPFDALVLP